MAEPGHEILIKDAIVFLFAAGVAVPVFRYLKLPSVVGFMLSGIALGPYALGSLSHNYPILEFVSISEPEAAAPFAELGVLFLLFLLGLEFSFEKLWALRRAVFGAGGLQAGISALAIGLIGWQPGGLHVARAHRDGTIGMRSVDLRQPAAVDRVWPHNASSP